MFKYLVVVLIVISGEGIAKPIDNNAAINNSINTFEKKHLKSNKPCLSCHADEVEQWKQSDHYNSMSVTTDVSVKGNFNNQLIEHFGQKALFFRKESKYFVTVSYDNKEDTYVIPYTFGHYPLQQYLVETEPGKLHVLPFAWDSREKTEGGQRWYHNYSHEEIRPEDRLHWRQPLQNWNGMCADCHSDGLVRNYDLEKNEFNTQWDNINVGCLSCHGDMSEHVNNSIDNTKDIARNPISQPIGQWLRNIGDKTAHWQGAKRDNSFMDSCFACHSLRSPLTDGFKYGDKFLDQFMPQLLQAPMYHADGQINEEVYVYGSFLQSKMFAAGVNCLDCHDKHTMKVKIEGNGLCLQCHSGEEYNVTEHHGHKEQSSGAQCVSCHMPTNRYMGVDDRRDHSFKIPRPAVSKTFGSPNACLSCHEEQSNDWAAASISNWHGKQQSLKQSQQDFMLLQAGQALPLDRHLAIVNDGTLDVISRATALQLLTQHQQPIAATQIKPYFSHQEALLRMSAAMVGELMSESDQNRYIAPLLKDELKAVRVAAARSLLSVNLNANSAKIFSSSYQELVTSNEVNSWRGEGRANQAAQAMRNNDLLGAEQNYLKAIEIDPYFEQAYTNLSEFYRQTQRINKSEKILKDGLKKLPKSSPILYAYGLHLVRQQQHKQAVLQFKRAHQTSPQVEQYLYTYVLALDSIGKTEQGLTWLLKVHESFRGSKMIREMGMYLSEKLRNKAAYDTFSRL